MPLNMSNPTILAEKNPPTMVDLGRGLCVAYGRAFNAYGIKGDSVHTCGYHRSFNALTQVPGTCGWSDGSIQSSLDNTNLDRDDCCALDFNPGSTSLMRTITGYLYNAARANDPRLRAIRRVAGTLNGTSVFSFTGAGGVPSGSFDSSHLWHLHIEFWRSRARWNHGGILNIMGGDMAGEVADFAAANVLTPENAVVGSHVALSRLLAESKQNRAILDVLLTKVELSPEDLQAIEDAAREGAQSGSSGASVDEVREVVDQELDEAFGGAKDTDV